MKSCCSELHYVAWFWYHHTDMTSDTKETSVQRRCWLSSRHVVKNSLTRLCHSSALLHTARWSQWENRSSVQQLRHYVRDRHMSCCSNQLVNIIGWLDKSMKKWNNFVVTLAHSSPHNCRRSDLRQPTLKTRWWKNLGLNSRALQRKTGPEALAEHWCEQVIKMQTAMKYRISTCTYVPPSIVLTKSVLNVLCACCLRVFFWSNVR